MKSRKRKTFRHNFIDKHTLPGALFLCMMAEIIAQVVCGLIIGGICAAFFPHNSDLQKIVLEVSVAIGAFIVLAIFWRYFYPEYAGSLCGGDHLYLWILFAVIMPLIVLAVQIMTLTSSRLAFPTAVNLAAAFMAGVSEEVIFRGVTASYLMRQWLEKKRILMVIIVSSLFFALSHVLNLLSGAPLDITLLQVVSSFFMGAVLCALFLRSGSLLPGMILHILFDIVALSDVSSFQEGGAYNSSITLSSSDIVETMIVNIIYLLIVLFLIRPSVQDKVYEIWKKKWRKISEE